MTKEPKKGAPEQGSPEKGERIAKRLSRAGICSRREAERWIEDGRVRVDGKKILTPATLVTAASQIVVDGKPVAEPERTRLWRYHKPDGLVCSTNDNDGRPTIYDKLPSTLPRVMTVGRLDLRSEGLLLLTNDGELARKLELPSTGWTRRYRARIFGTPDDASLAALANGITADGIKYGPVHARVESSRGDNSWLSVSLQEGKNREIRRVMEHLGFRVNRLIRVGYGPFQLGKLERGLVEEVTAKVVAEQTGGEVKPRLKPQPPRTKPPAIYTRTKESLEKRSPEKRPSEKRSGLKRPVAKRPASTSPTSTRPASTRLASTRPAVRKSPLKKSGPKIADRRRKT
jgi:23S rRNA pseudouridine2605 synthase